METFGDNLNDYKIYCIYGKHVLIQIHSNLNDKCLNYYDINLKLINIFSL